MSSLWVEFHYGLTNQIRTVQLVYPAAADVKVGKVSVMTPVGAALVGLSEAQSIEWRTLQGCTRNLKVLKVHPSIVQE